MASKPRLYITQELRENLEFFLADDQAHYLCNVLRLSAKSLFLAFDGKNGEFECEILKCDKKQVAARVLRQSRAFEKGADIWLLFAPVKKDRTDFIIEKATELGASKIVPVITRRTISEKIRKERYIAQAVEAAEQCRRLEVPEIEEARSLETVLKNWEEIKNKTKGMKKQSESLAAVPASLPALMRAQKMQSRAAKVGFDFAGADAAVEKLEEETKELREALNSGSGSAEELGDVLFSAVNVARFISVDAEECLFRATEKFLSRFQTMERLAEAEGRTLAEADMSEMDELWSKAKE